MVFHTAAPTRRGRKRGVDWSKLDWLSVSGIAGMHLACLAAPFVFSWSALVVMLVMAWVSGGLGITLGYHRLLTHRSFKCYPWMQYGLALVGCLAWQGGPVTWVSVHRVHHGRNADYLDRNYGEVLLVWDLLFRSHQPETETPDYGVLAPVDSESFVDIQSSAWRSLARDVRAARGLRKKLSTALGPPGRSYPNPPQ